MFNISNRYLNLRMVLRDLAVSMNLKAAFKGFSGAGGKEGESASEWFVISQSSQTVDELISAYGWLDARHSVKEPAHRPWTDQYVNILPALLAK